MLTIAQVHDEIDEAIHMADHKRPDYCTCVELEALARWREVLAAIVRLTEREPT